MSLCFQPYLTMGYVYHTILSYKNTIQSWDAGVCVLKNIVLTEWTPIDYKHHDSIQITARLGFKLSTVFWLCNRVCNSLNGYNELKCSILWYEWILNLVLHVIIININILFSNHGALSDRVITI